LFPYSDEAFFLPDEVVERALVIGGGVAGLQSALDLAGAGLEVVLVEREPSLGGRAAQIEALFPTLDHSVCALREKMVEVMANPDINVYTYSEIEGLSGIGGDFTAEIRKKARRIKENCTGCGKCWGKCPARTTSEFDFGIATRAAVYLPFAQAVPAIPTLDVEHCLHFTRGCDICSSICPVDAIDFGQEDEMVNEQVGVVVMACGFAPRDVTGFLKSSMASDPDVITSTQLERYLSGAGPTRGEVQRPSNGKRLKSVTFLSCPALGRQAGGLDGEPYCSRICCTNAAKQAIMLGKLYDGIELKVVYSETRTIDRWGAAMIERAKEEYEAVYIHGRARMIDRDGDDLVISGDYLDSPGQWRASSDIVVLASGIEAGDGFEMLSERLGVIGDENGFALQPELKQQPLETTVPGVFAAGAVTGPLDITESTMQGSGAASRAVAFVRKLSRQAKDTVG
jgi:heterodisulfide reductase subunit A